MIIDKLENISLYTNIPKEVTEFIANLSKDLSLGKYKLSKENFINVETYNTKSIINGKFESHKNYIDIQILLDGQERIYVTNINGLTILEPYNEDRDITFYSDNLDDKNYVTLDGTNFVVLFPHEAHAPQISEDDESKKVLKVVAKIKV